jgi:hypothetical protein
MALRMAALIADLTTLPSNSSRSANCRRPFPISRAAAAAAAADLLPEVGVNLGKHIFDLLKRQLLRRHVRRLCLRLPPPVHHRPRQPGRCGGTPCAPRVCLSPSSGLGSGLATHAARFAQPPAAATAGQQSGVHFATAHRQRIAARAQRTGEGYRRTTRSDLASRSPVTRTARWVLARSSVSASVCDSWLLAAFASRSRATRISSCIRSRCSRSVVSWSVASASSARRSANCRRAMPLQRNRAPRGVGSHWGVAALRVPAHRGRRAGRRLCPQPRSGRHAYGPARGRHCPSQRRRPSPPPACPAAPPRPARLTPW